MDRENRAGNPLVMEVDPVKDQYAYGGDIKHLPLYYYDLTPRLVQQAKDELSEDNSTIKAALSELRTLITDRNELEFPTDDVELMPFLRARKYNVRKAYAMYMKFFTQFRTYDKLFEDFDFFSILKTVQSNIAGFLLKRDDENCAVAIVLCGKWNPSEFCITDILKASMVATIDLIQCSVTQITGIKFILDCTGLTLSHFATLRPWHLKYVAEVIQKSTPLRFKGFHVCNHGWIYYYTMRVLKPMLSKKFVDRVHFHGQDIKGLHQFFSPSILPEELGGSAGPFDNAEFLKIFAQSKNPLTIKINKFNAKDS